MDKQLAQRIQALSPEKREQLAQLLKQKQSQPTQPPSAHYDLIILGGGLAGGTLARQVKLARPETKILVIEKNKHPVPEGAHKVGESTVELGSYYLRRVVNMEEHLETQHLRKAGLRFFFTAGDNRDITRRVELGSKNILPTATYQIDRGRLENALYEENCKSGVDVWDGASVKQVELTDLEHRVLIKHQGEERVVAGRWVVDASGRAGLLKRQLGLQKPCSHDVSSVWFRIDDEINAADWSNDPFWQARAPRFARRLSTTHLMGRGYWVWLIPLESGATSVGIVAESKLYPHADMNRFDRALAWLEKYEPQCAAAVRARQDKLQDFLALRHYSHDCQRVFSPQRWALTGEAGVFVDPFYSPGTDFISISNTMITALFLKDLRGEAITQDAELYNRIYLDTFHSYVGTFEHQYPLMGNAQVMIAKVAWDFSIYWGINSLIFFHNKTHDLAFWQAMRPALSRFDKLNMGMQQFFRDWDALLDHARNIEWTPAFFNNFNVRFIHDLHLELEAGLDEMALKAKLLDNLALLEAMAAEMYQRALRHANGAQVRSPLDAIHEHDRNSAQAMNGDEDAPIRAGALNGNHRNGADHLPRKHRAPDKGEVRYDVKAELSHIWLEVQEPVFA
ncbi:MAG: halogenase [Caldilinea sp. CFX5]|nr:halogenase [Caldilinea sp. CFX5]